MVEYNVGNFHEKDVARSISYQIIESFEKNKSISKIGFKTETKTEIDILRDYVRSHPGTKGQLSDPVYPDSIHCINSTLFFIANIDGVKSLIIYGNESLMEEFDGYPANIGSYNVRICKINLENSLLIRKYFPFTNPISHKGRAITIGLGDRLGIASPGHIRLIREINNKTGAAVFPVLAQQSIRELNLTGRNYREVLSSAVWSVFQEDFFTGYGADGDHLKTHEEVKMALDCGFTMITLDCSEHIDNSIQKLSDTEVDNLYDKLEYSYRKAMEDKYLNKQHNLKSGLVLNFEQVAFKRIILTYKKAIEHTVDIYFNVINKTAVDFEMSIDETLTPTTPEAHYFVAAELIDNKVQVTSLAPRFCGEFQKGIDYIGDIESFTADFITHSTIAATLGYKISVHSGSDKFSVFPVIGAKTGGKYHLKTAGTNWLEAVRTIANVNPSLFRRLHSFALTCLSDAKKYYHIKATGMGLPEPENMNDSQLPTLLEHEDTRQVIHITYGLILQAVNDKGGFVFRDEIFKTLADNENAYYDALYRHIGRHLSTLGIQGVN